MSAASPGRVLLLSAIALAPLSPRALNPEPSATVVSLAAPPDEDDLEDYKRIEVIYDGLTGLCWLQRPFEEEELEMLEEHGWPPVLRKDFLRPALLTEDEVIEIQESLVRR